MSIVSLPKVVLFDWDGTLADSYAFLEGAHDYTLDKLGLVVPPSGWYNEYFGKPPHLIYGFIYGDLAEAARDLFLAYFHKHSAEATQPLPGAIDVILWLRKQGIVTGVVTNMLPAGVHQKITEFGWSDYFDVVVGAGEAARNKPSPDPVVLALERCGYEGDAGDVWFLGDTINDIEAACGAGCQALLVSKSAKDVFEDDRILMKIVGYGEFLAFLRGI